MVGDPLNEYYRYPLIVKKLFVGTLYRDSEKLIVYRDRIRYSYEEFYEHVKKLSAGLKSIGVTEGDRVAVLDWDTNRYLESYFAVPLIGAVLHTVNIRYPPELILYTMQHAGDRYVIVRDEFLPLIERAKTLFDFVRGWIVYSEDGTVSTALSPAYNYDDLLKKGSMEFPDLDENRAATTFYTSGTTGLPKGVTFTHRDIVLQTLAVSLELTRKPVCLTQNDVLLSLVPMFHVHSWCMPYIALLNGLKYVIPGKYDPQTIAELIRKEKVTVSAMVPPLLHMILEIPNIEEYVKHGFRVIVGGGTLSKGLMEKARSAGIETVSGYGMSETAPVLTMASYSGRVVDLPDVQKWNYRRTAGLPIPLAEIKVVDPKGMKVPNDGSTVGEIVARAPWLTEGYVNDPDKSESLWKGGWLHTEDLAVVDRYGYIQIVGRERDNIKSLGEFIPAVILEDAISSYPGVAEVAVVGKHDEKWGERPVAFIISKKILEKEKIVEHLMKFVTTGTIAKFWIPDEFIFVNEFKRTSTGKIDKKALMELLE